MSGAASEWRIAPAWRVAGTVRLPGDKSLSHRALILSALSPGTQRIEGLSAGLDVLATARILASLGVPVRLDGDEATVGEPPGGRLHEPGEVLDCGNSGTTMRLLAGLLAGQDFLSVLTGDASLRSRPMGRVTRPLGAMGAVVDGRCGGELAPLAIRGGGLRGIVHQQEVASAQVKSSLMLAGLFSTGWLEIREPAASRDHTERMLAAAGVDLEARPGLVRMECGQRPRMPDEVIRVPADVSASAFFAVAAQILPGSALLLPGVSYNETRRGYLDLLDHSYSGELRQLGEERVDLKVASCDLAPRPLVLAGPDIPRLIDEIPILAILAARRPGTSRIRDAAELRTKESDRIRTTASMLGAFGVTVRTRADGMDIEGDPDRPFRGGCTIDSLGDHRIAMASAIGALAADAPVTIRGVEAVDTSFPGFLSALEDCVER